MAAQKKKYKKHRHPGVRPGKKPETFRIDYYDWEGKHRSTIFHGTEVDAARYRRAILAKVDRIKNGLEPPPAQTEDPPTLLELWEDFYGENQFRVKSGSMKERSLERYRNSLEALLDFNPQLGNTLITGISWKDFEEFKVYRKEQGFSPEGINTNLRNFRTIFKYAETRDILKHSPLKQVPFIKTPKRDVRYLDEDEMKSLNVVLKSLDLENEFERDARDLVVFFLYTGARTSEALYPSFSWSCIRKDKIYFPETKTYTERAIPLTEMVKQILEGRSHISGGPFFTPFYQKIGNDTDLENNHITRDMVYNRTRFVFQRANLEGVSTHDLRRTAGAYYYIATRDIFAASRFLGHSSVKVTESHYVGLIQSLQSENSQKFDRTLTETLRGVR